MTYLDMDYFVLPEDPRSINVNLLLSEDEISSLDTFTNIYPHCPVCRNLHYYNDEVLA